MNDPSSRPDRRCFKKKTCLLLDASLAISFHASTNASTSFSPDYLQPLAILDDCFSVVSGHLQPWLPTRAANKLSQMRCTIFIIWRWQHPRYAVQVACLLHEQSLINVPLRCSHAAIQLDKTQNRLKAPGIIGNGLRRCRMNHVNKS